MASGVFKASYQKSKQKVIERKSKNPHRSFRRSYREDYERELKVPGYFAHAFATFKFLFSNWPLFIGLLAVAMFLLAGFVGIMNEATYTKFQDLLNSSSAGNLNDFAKSGLILISTITSGGFISSLSQGQAVIAVFVFLIVWLITIYLIRHLLAGQKPRLRDGCFNALSPLLSSCVVAVFALISLIPIAVFVVVLSAATSTNLLSTPAYAFVFCVFAALLILLSLYLFSNTLVALIAVSAPGVYPLVALHSANELINGRRIRFILRIIFCAVFVAVIWAVVMIPLILIDISLKANLEWLAGVPFIPACLLFMTCATFIYATAYFYLFYRRMLDND